MTAYNPPPPSPPAHPWRRRAAVIALLVAPLALAAVLVPLDLAARVRRAERTWAGAAVTPASLASELRPWETNDTAREVEGLAAELGISLAPFTGAATTPDPAVEDQLKAVNGWLNREVERSGPELVPPPAAIREALVERRPRLAAIAARLNAGDPPRWRLDPGAGLGDPVLPFHRMLRLGQLLVATALLHDQEGDAAAARELMAADARIDAHLVERPELMAVLVGLAGKRRSLRALRKLDGIPPSWLDEHYPARPRDAVQRGLANEARLLLRGARGDDGSLLSYFTLGSGSSAPRLAFPWLIALYVRYSMADGAEYLGLKLQEAARRDRCADDSGALDREGPDPRWAMHRQRTTDSLVRAALVEIDRDLTRRVLALQADGGDDGFGSAAGDDRRVAACPERAWDYCRREDGARCITFAGRPPRPPGGARWVHFEHCQPDDPAAASGEPGSG